MGMATITITSSIIVIKTIASISTSMPSIVIEYPTIIIIIAIID